MQPVLSKIDKDASVTAATLSKTMTVLNAIQWVSSAIKEIKGEPVRKCFAGCGLVEHSQDTEFEDDDVPIAQLVELFRTAHKRSYSRVRRRDEVGGLLQVLQSAI